MPDAECHLSAPSKAGPANSAGSRKSSTAESTNVCRRCNSVPSLLLVLVDVDVEVLAVIMLPLDENQVLDQRLSLETSVKSDSDSELMEGGRDVAADGGADCVPRIVTVDWNPRRGNGGAGS
jgi:hypothetical protein